MDLIWSSGNSRQRKRWEANIDKGNNVVLSLIFTIVLIFWQATSRMYCKLCCCNEWSHQLISVVSLPCKIKCSLYCYITTSKRTKFKKIRWGCDISTMFLTPEQSIAVAILAMKSVIVFKMPIAAWPSLTLWERLATMTYSCRNYCVIQLRAVVPLKGICV